MLLLEEMGFTNVRSWLRQRFGTGIGSDDLIDACACAIAARDGVRRLPEKDEAPDEKGLVMRIWY